MIFKLLLIYLVTLPFMKTFNLPFLAERAQFSEAVFLFLFLLWISGLIKDKKLPQMAGLNKQYMLFLFFCLLSFFRSSNLFISFMELLGLIYLYVMLVLVADIVDDVRKIDTVVKVWIGTSVVILALGFIGWFICIILGERNIFCNIYHNQIPYINPCYRVESTFKLAQGLGNYLVVSLGFVVSDLLLTDNKKYKIFLKFMIFFICLGVLATFSRSLFSLMLASFLIYNHFHKAKNLQFRIIRFLLIFSIIISFLFIIIICSTFYIPSYKIESFSKDTHEELVININYTYDKRFLLKTAAIEMTKRHPFLGVGLGIFPSYYHSLNSENYFKKFIPSHYYLYGSQYEYSFPATDPHNDFLQYFAETGIFGGSAFVIFIATFLYLIFASFKKVKSENRYFEVRLFCFFASFIGVLTEAIDYDMFKIRHVWFLMALILALIIMHKKETKVNL